MCICFNGNTSMLTFDSVTYNNKYKQHINLFRLVLFFLCFFFDLKYFYVKNMKMNFLTTMGVSNINFFLKTNMATYFY